MARYALMLRGINLGPHRRVAMAALRELLTEAGFDDVATYVQSGNVALASGLTAPALERAVSRLIAERFGFEAPATARTHAELAAVLAGDPIPGAAQEPKRYQVTFLAQAPDAETVSRLAALASATERLVAEGRELYSFHPAGIARSKLAAQLTAKALGTQATARNWTTVTTLAEMTA